MTRDPDVPARPGAVILAAGESSRMGTPKQLLRLRGSSLLRLVTRAAFDAGCRPIAVVLGAGAADMAEQIADLGAEPVLNPEPRRGIGSSIRCGARRLLEGSPKLSSVLILLCDQPLVRADDLGNLIAARAASGQPVCVSEYAGTIGPPVLIDASLLPDLLTLPDDQGAKALWTRRPEIVERVPCSHAAVDVDTPEDWRRLNDGPMALDAPERNP